MNSFEQEYACDVAESKVILRGIFRLASPSEYDKIFDPIKQALENNTQETPCIDVTYAVFLNSAGITALSRLVILARTRNRPLEITGSAKSPWQKKSLPPLTKLYERLHVKLT